MEEAARTVKTGAIYRHFKGRKYQVLMIATHSETKEDMVIARQLETGLIFARPMDIFLSRVDTRKYPNCEQEWKMVEV